MTKKDKIMRMFDSIDWIHGKSKIITYEHFQSIGLSPSVEYGEKYCDVIYAQQIFRKLGYKTAIGMALHIYKK